MSEHSTPFPHDPLRVIISGGGTGGHIFPAIAIADALKEANGQTQILFVGAEGRMEAERVPQAGYPIKLLPVQGLNRKKIWKNFAVLKSLIRSRYLAREIIRDFRPQVVIGVGGYASAPTLKEAQAAGIPTLLQEQNSFAGVTNKLLAKECRTVCVAYKGMERFFPPHKIVFTGNPVRPSLEYGTVSRSEGLQAFGLPASSQAPTLLVMGGSLGALSINRSVSAALPEWRNAGIQLIWQTGKSYAQEAQQQLQEAGYTGAVALPFIDRMEAAYAAADLVVSRAGALSISEICLLGKPSVLIPSPNVAEDHQTKNAQAVATAGGAQMIPDNSAVAVLGERVLNLLRDPKLPDRMGAAARTLAGPDAARKIVQEVYKLLPATR